MGPSPSGHQASRTASTAGSAAVSPQPSPKVSRNKIERSSLGKTVDNDSKDDDESMTGGSGGGDSSMGSTSGAGWGSFMMQTISAKATNIVRKVIIVHNYINST